LEWAKYVLTPEVLNNNLFLAKDIKKRAAWYRAAETSKLEELRKLWKWVKERVIPGVLKNKLKLAKADR